MQGLIDELKHIKGNGRKKQKHFKIYCDSEEKAKKMFDILNIPEYIDFDNYNAGLSILIHKYLISNKKIEEKVINKIIIYSVLRYLSNINKHKKIDNVELPKRIKNISKITTYSYSSRNIVQFYENKYPQIKNKIISHFCSEQSSNINNRILGYIEDFKKYTEQFPTVDHSVIDSFCILNRDKIEQNIKDYLNNIAINLEKFPNLDYSIIKRISKSSKNNSHEEIKNFDINVKKYSNQFPSLSLFTIKELCKNGGRNIEETIQNYIDYIKIYSNQFPEVDSSVIKVFCKSSSPPLIENRIKNYIINLEKYSNQFPEVDASIVKELCKGDPDNIQILILKYIENVKKYTEQFPEVDLPVIKVFCRNNESTNIETKIIKYLNNVKKYSNTYSHLPLYYIKQLCFGNTDNIIKKIEEYQNNIIKYSNQFPDLNLGIIKRFCIRSTSSKIEQNIKEYMFEYQQKVIQKANIILQKIKNSQNISKIRDRSRDKARLNEDLVFGIAQNYLSRYKLETQLEGYVECLLYVTDCAKARYSVDILAKNEIDYKDAQIIVGLKKVLNKVWDDYLFDKYKRKNGYVASDGTILDPVDTLTYEQACGSCEYNNSQEKFAEVTEFVVKSKLNQTEKNVFKIRTTIDPNITENQKYEIILEQLQEQSKELINIDVELMLQEVFEYIQSNWNPAN